MTADPRMIAVMNYYRDAELRGANLLFRLMSHLEDTDSQVKLSLHFHEETRHAWLWTKRINELGGTPAKVGDGYQSRIGLRTVPRSLIEILALTVIVEERSLARYSEHAARPDVDRQTLTILKEVAKDEKWHVAWIRNKLEDLARAEGAEGKMREALERYTEIDRQVYGQLRDKERDLFALPIEQFESSR